MRPLSYARATGVDEAVADRRRRPASAFLAGGTTEVDLVRLGVARPDLLVDINRPAARPASRTSPAAGCASARWRG